MKKSILTILSVLAPFAVYGQEPVMSWNFDGPTVFPDTIEGLFDKKPGIKGEGVLLDGFTTRVIRQKDKVAPISKEFTVDAWLSLGNYPWNWCPILTTETNETKGYRLMVGPYGQVSLQVAVGEQWIVCTTPDETLPLRDWMHVTGTYTADDKLAVYVNGKLICSVPVKGRASFPKSDCILGMTASETKPSDIHRTWGTLAQYHGLDGILDEVKVYDKALGQEAVADLHRGVTVPESVLEPRHFPEVKSTGEFKAYYTKLKYYPGWDNVWRVGDDPDVVVSFKETPIRMAFWRGMRYGASWISENNNWMTDQSVECWDDVEGCFEHMQDRHCRFSHVRIIENTPGRIVVHWRYAPVSAYDHTWGQDEKTGWEAWVDEYYFIYPDGSAVRKVSWTKGSLGPVRQFQESLALLAPGQRTSDLVERTYASVSDYEGKRGEQKILDKMEPADPYLHYTIQRYNYKSEHKPFICFEPGNTMTLMNSGSSRYNYASGCNHFPEGQARCDGRTTKMADRISSMFGFPISDPVIHEGKIRNYWCGLYGMTDKNMDELQAFGRAWAYAPELSLNSKGIQSNGYDRSERTYQLETIKGKPSKVDFVLKGTKDSPIINPSFYVKNWNGREVEVLIDGKKYSRHTQGIYETIDGKDLIVFLFLEKTDNIHVVLKER